MPTNYAPDPNLSTLFDFGSTWRTGPLGSDANGAYRNNDPAYYVSANRSCGCIVRSAPAFPQSGFLEADLLSLDGISTYAASIKVRSQNWIAGMTLRMLVGGLLIGTLAQNTDAAFATFGPFNFAVAAINPTIRFEMPAAGGQSPPTRQWFLDDALVELIRTPIPAISGRAISKSSAARTLSKEAAARSRSGSSSGKEH